MFLDDIVDDNVLPRLSLAVDGLTDTITGDEAELGWTVGVPEPDLIPPSTYLPNTPLDPEQLEETVNTHKISMCGQGPIMTMLTACMLRGAKSSRLLSYGTSGDITGDPSRVVGYASVEITL